VTDNRTWRLQRNMVGDCTLFTSERLGGPASSVQALVDTDTGKGGLGVAEGHLLDIKEEVMTYFINDENMKICRHIDTKIGNGNGRGVIGRESEISLLTEDRYAHLLSQVLGMLGLNLQSTVPVTAFGSRSWRMKKQVYIALYIGDDYFENVFLVSDQLIESLLIGADSLQQYGLVVNSKINCLMYEIEGNVKERKFTNEVDAQLEPQKGTDHVFPETAVHDVTQTINGESVWTVGEYVAFVSRNWELYCEVVEGELGVVL
jgi:hypothetical protein